VPKHPVKDTYGVIETPETSGLIPEAISAIDAGPSPGPLRAPPSRAFSLLGEIGAIGIDPQRSSGSEHVFRPCPAGWYNLV
jgi:hypothetical protein